MTRLYHYTTQDVHAPKILDSGELQPRKDGAPEHEKPLLWFSKNHVWENTATKTLLVGGELYSLTLEQLFNEYGCVRFSMDKMPDGLMDFKTACKYAGIPTKQRLAMERFGIEKGANPKHWYALKDPVSIEGLLMEVMTDVGVWEAIGILTRA